MTRSLWVPEVVQTSSTDCGPASLASVLAGFGVAADSYERLREACHTDLDGSSIDTLEDVLKRCGLRAFQQLVPVDHVGLDAADVLPAIAVTRLPTGFTHFVVLWRRVGRWIMVMDPAAGRRWVEIDALRRQLHTHEQRVLVTDWREWAATPAFVGPLRQRLAALGAPADQLLERRLGAGSGLALAALDAATRLTTTLVRARGVRPGAQAAELIEQLAERAAAGDTGLLPARFWSALPGAAEAGVPAELQLTGAVLLSVRGGARGPAPARDRSGAPAPRSRSTWASVLGLWSAAERRQLWLGLALAVVLAACAVLEGLALRALLESGTRLTLLWQRALALLGSAGCVALSLGLDTSLARAASALGRLLESALRMRFALALPRLGVPYFQSRPASDLAERLHSLHRLRSAPELLLEVVRALATSFASAFAIGLVDPVALVPALSVASACAVIPWLARPLLTELDLRVRSHAAALVQQDLDALNGLTPLRMHDATAALRREHERLLAEWLRSAQRLLIGSLGVSALIAALSTGLLIWLTLARAPNAPGMLLLVGYWALCLDDATRQSAVGLRLEPHLKNLARRVLDPLQMHTVGDSGQERPIPAPRQRGAELTFEDVTLQAQGHVVLEHINLRISPGEQVAIVGASGAGKSTLLALLLGFRAPTTGRVLVDGQVLDGAALAELRQETAWVDPAVQLWNASLLENLTYGSADAQNRVGAALRDAHLHQVVQRLPDGLQSRLGEGGALVSGGEGQRVRFARALLRSGARLALLDEPFRGLEAEDRRLLGTRARASFRGATLLCVTHDVQETLDFERVLVLDGGRVVEDGAPGRLERTPGSRYGVLLEAERNAQTRVWGGVWRRLFIERARLREVGTRLEAS